MKGWKMKVGAFIIALAPMLGFFGFSEFTDPALAFGGALTAYGAGHKIEKNKF